MISKYIRLLIRNRYLALFAILLSVGASLYAAKGIQVRFQFKDFYDYPGSPGIEVFRRYSEEFGDPAGYVVLLLQSEDVFQPETLRYLETLAKALEPSPLFKSIRSLATTNVIRAAGDAVETGPLIPPIPDTPESIQRLRASALGDSLLQRRLVSEDGTLTAVLAEMRIPALLATVPEQSEAVKAVREVVQLHPPPPGVKTMITGGPVVEVETTEALIHDQLILTPAVLFVLMALLFLTFRSISGVLLPLAAIGVSLAWTAAVFAALGKPADLNASIIPTTLLVYGSVDPVFMLTRYRSHAQQGVSSTDAIVRAASELMLPCFVSSVTTAVGFAAFAIASVPTIRTFGGVVAIGVMFTFVTTLTVLPLLLAMMPAPQSARVPRDFAKSLDAGLKRLWSWVEPRRLGVTAAAIVFIMVGAFAFSRLRIENTYVGLGPAPARALIRLLEEKLSGVIRFSVYLEGPPGSMRTPEALRSIDTVTRSVRGDEIVTSAMSLADVLAAAQQAFNDGDPAQRRLPESESLIAQYLQLIDPADRAEFVPDDYSQTHIRILARDAGSHAAARFERGLERLIDDQDFERLGIRAAVTGNGVLAYRETDKVANEVLWGFVYAFLIIVIIQWVAFRSAIVALVSIIPNLVPIGACFLVMWLSGLDVRVDNSLVLCIAVGGLFNATIQIIARVQAQCRDGASDPNAVISHALRAVGPPTLYTASMLSAGFSVLLLSDFAGLRELGFLCAVTLLTGFVADAVVTTAILRAVYPWRRAIAASSRKRLTAESVGVEQG